jgi:hypothetical protein
MKRKGSFGLIAAAALLAVSVHQPAQAQSKPVGCNLAWCPILVEVIKTPSGTEMLRTTFDEVRMAPKYSNATVVWKLVGSPDYEFRADSVTSTGANSPWAATQFPLRLVSATEYGYDNLNNSAGTYGYQVRVYKKGSPAGSTPIVANGTIVNAN